MTRIFKPTYVVEGIGEVGRLPDGAIINIGGTAGPTFTVDGRALLFSDGTATDGGAGLSAFNLQVTYNASASPAKIDLVSGKDFVLNAVNSKKFIFDAGSGTVTIEGDLNVLGASSVIEGTISNLDQVNINPPLPTTVGLIIAPMAGITPSVNLMEVKGSATGPVVFGIGPTGTTSVSDIVIAGTLNGVPVAQLIGHIDALLTPAKHSAAQVSFDDSALTNISGDDVQEAIESIDSKLNLLSVGNVIGYEHVQVTPSAIWTITHGANSQRVQATIWDEDNSAILPDTLAIITPDMVRVVFSSPQVGRAILMIF